MGQPLVSVFIPLYNCAAYISDALDSIVNQTYSNLEIIIIDDGSTDNSVEIVRAYKDSRIRLIVNECNKGIPYTRNLGLHECNGTYMAVMDADDIAHLSRIEKLVDFMELNSDVDVVGSYFKSFGEGQTKISKFNWITPEAITPGLIFANRLGNPTSLIRLGTLRENGICYNLDYFVAQDYDLWVQVSKIGKLCILPEVLLQYRTGHVNITKTSLADKIIQRKKIIDSIHRDMLAFYKFNLTESEIIIFNEFFDDNYHSTICNDTIVHLPKVLAKMIEHNRSNRIFNEELFLTIIKDTVFMILNRRKLGFVTKLNLYNRVCSLTNNRGLTKNISYMITKHVYKLLSS